MSNKLGIFLAGGAVGAVAALLCAPRTGQEARTMVAEKVNEAWGQAQNISADAGVNAQQVYQSAAARVQEVASNLKPSFTQDNDELRDKIEAARQRIASQVAKNAEETGQATEEVVEAVAEAVEPAAEAVAEAAEQAEEPKAE